MTTDLDIHATYQVKRWPGVAVRIHGFPMIWEPMMFLCTDEDGNEWEEADDTEGEWIPDLDCGDVLVVMIGDDKKHRVSADDLVLLDDLDYCIECGQIGCSHDGRDRG